MKFLAILFLIFSGCRSDREVQEDGLIKTYYDSGELKCKYQADENGNKEGEYYGYYRDGQLKEFTTWLNDTTIVNEQRLYFSNGQLREYNFFDLLGYRRYTRSFDEQGNLLEEKGDFICYEVVKSKVLKGDSSLIKIYVATPPGCTHEIFGFNSEGKYKIDGEHTQQPYLTILEKKEERVGEYVFPFEIVFVDTINHTKETRKDDVSFSVIEAE